jgi:hypothetical protein
VSVNVIIPKRITKAVQVNGTLSSHAVAPAAASSSMIAQFRSCHLCGPLLLRLPPPPALKLCCTALPTAAASRVRLLC